ncbi:PLP-dependent aminotransferase family protein [Variovorax sp. VNK109]|uniref:MocR-like pyridoxine biosynthesis transcription factor PdxR n=1 Tax=Variovorax sp. VNK109 TaxID=3400919 RepID=UPI003C106598
MMLPPLDGQGSLYTQLYRCIRAAILAKTLLPEHRLPSTRDMATELGVSRNTVLQAYEQLLAEGYLESRLGSGTYVAGRIPDEALAVRKDASKQASVPARVPLRLLSEYARRVVGPESASLMPPDPRLRIDFRYGAPNLDDFPAEEWRALTAQRLRRLGKPSLMYAEPGGHLPLREAIVRYVREHRGINCTAQDVIVVNGSQQALDIVARALLDPGDRVLMENPTYPGARVAFQALGAKIESIPVDSEGLDVNRVMRLQHRAKLAYVTPSHQFPTGGVMMLARRLSFLQWAHDSQAFVLEDDYDSEYRYSGRPIEAIQSLDTYGQVIYLGTFSKILAPSLRLGYIISPPALTATLQRIKSVTDRHTSLLSQEVLAEFIQSGQFERHLRRSRTRNSGRRQALLRALNKAFGDSISVQGENAGLHVLLWFRDRPASQIDDIVQRATAKGIGVYSIAPYYAGTPPRAGLLLGYGSLEEVEIVAGVNALAQALR